MFQRSDLVGTPVLAPVFEFIFYEGGHRAIKEEGGNACTICGEPYWAEIHRLAQRGTGPSK